MAGKVAIVTGSNKGLGYAIVEGLCRKFDGTVYLTARNEELGREAVAKLNAIGLKPMFHQLDVSDKDSVRKLADFIKTKHGGLDVLVNNAGVLYWDSVYPTYEVAKATVEVNYKSLLTIEEFIFPLLRKGAKVVNVSSSCGHLANLKNDSWIKTLQSEDLTTEELNKFVDNYLESVKSGTFKKEDFADDGKHAEHRVAKIAVTALTFIQHRKYFDRDIAINAVYPGYIKTDMANGGGEISAEKAASIILYLIFDASPNLKGTFMWDDGKLVDWHDADDNNGMYYCKGIW